MFALMLNLLTTYLPKLLTERPDLLIDHALAYASLAKGEIEAMKRQLVRRILAGAVALASALAFVVLSGVALMMYATQPQITSAWVLLAVPGVMLVLTLLATAVALSAGKPPAESLTRQLQIDLQTFRAAVEPRT